jgi:deferrochelatase/peroxidase EfeB
MACPFRSLWQTLTANKLRAPHALAQDQVSLPTNHSRRAFLMNSGVAGSALAIGSLNSIAQAQTQAATLPGTTDNESKMQSQPFYSKQQSGITTPQQAAMMLVAFDVLASDKAGLVTLFQRLTERIAFLMAGGQVAEQDDKLPPLDSGIMGTKIYPDNLTITVSVGNSIFDQRFGLSALKPRQLKPMSDFPNDALDAKWCHGDVLLQLCANSNETILHALRDIIKHTPELMAVRWRRDGFISAHAGASQGKETPINLLGFKDGTANPDTHNQQLAHRILWVSPEHNEPAWAVNGAYQAVRLIRFYVERWDRTPLQEQESIFGRQRASGAPLGKSQEHDDPDYASDPQGKRIPLDAHIRLANPRTPETEKNLILRRGYSYDAGISASGQLDMGLLFVCWQASLDNGFIAVQNKLNGEPLEEYIKPFGGGYFFTLPGVAQQGSYLAQSLLEA